MTLEDETAMTTFLPTTIIAFLLFAGAVFVINFCKARSTGGKHELTGMCHKSGGASCCSAIANGKKADGKEKCDKQAVKGEV